MKNRMMLALFVAALSSVTAISAHARPVDVEILPSAEPSCGQDGDPCGAPFIDLKITGAGVDSVKYCGSQKDVLNGPNEAFGTPALEMRGYSGGLSAKEYLRAHGEVILIVTSDIAPGVCVELRDQQGNPLLKKNL
ncbi:MAG: hypothetical protein ACXVB9_14230 [Bdellovibrionota bacterium]